MREKGMEYIRDKNINSSEDYVGSASGRVVNLH
jgi:hypothetical protein